jgi:DNA (cytosine-5)-methyltransferase 1
MTAPKNCALRELSLFTGGGGGLLGSTLLGWKTIGAIEIEEYPCRVLEQRQKDGCLDKFPIWNMDIREFNRRVANIYTGMVDIITGGFPCQDISCAGKGKGIDGETSGLFMDMAETIRIVRPKYVFMENSPLITIRGLETVLSEMAELGYDAKWSVLGSDWISDAGTLRKRFWCLAVDHNFNGKRLPIYTGKYFKNKFWCEQTQAHIQDVETSWFVAHNYAVGTIDDVAGTMERTRAIGNGQIPMCMAAAFQILSHGMI